MAERVDELQKFVREAAATGMALRDVERGIFDRLLPVGHSCTKMFIALQGDGDLGETRPPTTAARCIAARNR